MHWFSVSMIKMKVFIFASLAFAAVILASPLDKKTKNEAFGKCAKLCQDDSDKPICATDGDKAHPVLISFLNECILKKYNCEHNKIMTKKGDGACANGQSIRVS